MNYTLFLIGLFIIAAGLGCLETAANPFVTVLGPESGGHFRLNLAQTFNSFGAIIAVVFGQSLILSNVPHQPQEVLDKMTPEQLSAGSTVWSCRYKPLYDYRGHCPAGRPADRLHPLPLPAKR